MNAALTEMTAMTAMTETPPSFRDNPFVRFVRAPIEPRSYANLLFLALAFPLGLVYFLFLVVGLSLGLGLLIVWLGVPVLAAVLAGSWLFAAMERQMAIHLLGAEVPPMSPPGPAEETVWRRLRAFLANPVTWKGMGYLAIKFPLGLATFVVGVTLPAVCLSFLLAPIFYRRFPLDLALTIDGRPAIVDGPGEAFFCFLIGAGLTLVTFNLLNALAGLWGKLAIWLLGSPRFAAPSS